MDTVLISRTTGPGRYTDIIDVCEELAKGDAASGGNAIAIMVRQSPLFRRTLAKLKRRADATD